MRRTTAIGSALIAATVMTLGLGTAASASSAGAPDDPSGLYFVSGSWSDPAFWDNVVAHYPTPPAGCTPVPTKASGHVAWDGGFTAFQFFKTADCTGPITGMDTLRTYPAGQYKSFIAVR
jgi:hypothetical protein